MVINDIGRTEFIRRLAPHSDLEHLIGKEVEWFSNKTGNIIGTIALGDKSRGWNYVILKRNPIGTFHVCGVACDFYNLAAARVDFMFAMVLVRRGRGQNKVMRLSQNPPGSPAPFTTRYATVSRPRTPPECPSRCRARGPARLSFGGRTSA